MHEPASVRVAVLTPTLPSRPELLAEAVASVNAQSLRPVAHLIGVDHEEMGIGGTLNRLASSADADWLARLDDDDLIDPSHLETLAARTNEADILYSWCRIVPRSTNGSEPPYPSVIGRSGWTPNQTFDPERLHASNYIPATALIRKSLWHELGGWQRAGYGVAGSPASAEGTEDWDFWLRALEAGARFLCIPTVTWSYRYHGGNLWLK